MLSSGDKYWTEVDAKDKYWTCLGQKLGLKVISWTNTWHGHFQDIWRTFAGHILAWDKVRTNVGILTLSTSTEVGYIPASNILTTNREGRHDHLDPRVNQQLIMDMGPRTIKWPLISFLFHYEGA